MHTVKSRWCPGFANEDAINRNSASRRSASLRRLAGTRPERWARCQRAWAHAKSGAEWRRHVAQHVATAGTAAVIADRAGGIRAQPVATEVALRVDALDGETGQILHIFIFPQRRAEWP